ncbi:unnamed protein product [Heterotrigona itama]|uniref:Uncharacterized protein n=1 Tax=Heterotrigona itama TaxID=395501 RepID=A0A6V7GWF1_9HYME|nr:unnamed protein product [Heterotrigona itama]
MTYHTTTLYHRRRLHGATQVETQTDPFPRITRKSTAIVPLTAPFTLTGNQTALTTAGTESEINNFSQKIPKSFRDATHRHQNQNKHSSEDPTYTSSNKETNIEEGFQNLATPFLNGIFLTTKPHYCARLALIYSLHKQHPSIQIPTYRLMPILATIIFLQMETHSLLSQGISYTFTDRKPKSTDQVIIAYQSISWTSTVKYHSIHLYTRLHQQIWLTLLLTDCIRYSQKKMENQEKSTLIQIMPCRPIWPSKLSCSS